MISRQGIIYIKKREREQKKKKRERYMSMQNVSRNRRPLTTSALAYNGPCPFFSLPPTTRFLSLFKDLGDWSATRAQFGIVGYILYIRPPTHTHNSPSFSPSFPPMRSDPGADSWASCLW